MRRAINILFGAIATLLASATVSFTHAFDMDISPAEAAHRTGETLLADVAIGERARFTYYLLLICRDETNSLYVSTESRIYKNDEDYGGYMKFYDVERLPSGSVALTSVPSSKDKDSRISIYQSLSVVLSCQLLAQLQRFDMKSLLPVDTIDGKKSLSQLLPAP